MNTSIQDIGRLFTTQSTLPDCSPSLSATSRSYIKSIQSIFSLHNETVNIYSHLIGSILFTTLPFVIHGSLWSRYATASHADVAVFSTFFFGVVVWFSLSTIYHTFNNHSERTYALFSQLDFIGIVILIWGCTLPSIYYDFYCDPSHQLKYYILVSVLASSYIYITQHSSFRQPRYRHHRALVYSGLAFSFMGPIIHGIIEFGWETQMRRMSLDWMELMGTLNICGAALYALRVSTKRRKTKKLKRANKCRYQRGGIQEDLIRGDQAIS